jgi:hypothetical protein
LVGRGLIVVGLEWSWVDLKQQVVRLNQIAFLERNFVHVAGDVGTDINGFGRFEPTGKILEVGHAVGDGRGDDDIHGLGRALARRRRRPAAAGEDRAGQDHERARREAAAPAGDGK